MEQWTCLDILASLAGPSVYVCVLQHVRRTYDILWREAMMELLDQLEAESPEDPALAPKASSLNTAHATKRANKPKQPLGRLV